MEQTARRMYLIKELLREQPEYEDVQIPENNIEQKQLLRSLMNIRMPQLVDDAFLQVQDEYLRSEIEEIGIVDVDSLIPVKKDIYVWKGNIIRLKCDAIVNAANANMLGCFSPCHECIDNMIHTFAGIELRNECAQIMNEQGAKEEPGKAKITPAYNLPCKYIIHTVGPRVHGNLTAEDEEILASCYDSCLELAEINGVKSIAFCCISTGEFKFPNDRAAEIAIERVNKYKAETYSDIKVIFNVFKDIDWELYNELLRK